MLIRRPDDVLPSEITPQRVYLNRREFMLGAAGLLLAGNASAALATRKSPLSTSEQPNHLLQITRYNNFYEFGTDKADPAANSGSFRPRPWQLRVEGEAQQPRTFDLDELMKLAPLEERIYRMRCVEGWSMVIPWVGFPLAALLQKVGPTSRAKAALLAMLRYCEFYFWTFFVACGVLACIFLLRRK